jgi:hypothetical protein
MERQRVTEDEGNVEQPKELGISETLRTSPTSPPVTLPTATQSPLQPPPLQRPPEPMTKFQRFQVALSVIQILVLGVAGAILGYKQTEINEHQHQLASRPYILSTVDQPSNGKIMWTIQNAGDYPVVNVKLQIIRFTGHREGWDVTTVNRNIDVAEILKGGNQKVLDLCEYVCNASSVYPEMNVIHPGYVVAILSFDRKIDGKRYLLLEPFFIEGRTGQRYPMSVSTFGGESGILRRCSGESGVVTELLRIYSRANPMSYPAELYNYTYLFDPMGTPCLDMREPPHPSN